MRLTAVIATKGRMLWAARQCRLLSEQMRPEDRIIVVLDGQHEDEAIPERAEVVRLAESVGPDRAKRIGISFAEPGDVVLEIDDHDLIRPGALDRIRETFRDPGTVAAYCDCDVIVREDPSDPESAEKYRERKGKPSARTFADRGNIGYGLRMFRKWASDVAGGYPVREEWFPANDYAHMATIEQVFGQGAIAHIPDPLVDVLQTVRGVSGSHAARQEAAVKSIAELALGRRLPSKWESMRYVSGVRSPSRTLVGSTARALSIPKILHFVWCGPEMPDWARENIERFEAINPEYITMLHGEEMLLEEFRKGYEQIDEKKEWCRKSDLIRLSALVRFGGWYFDTDFLPVRPIDDIVKDHGGIKCGAFVTQGTPRQVANGIIGVNINSPFLRAVREEAAALSSKGTQYTWDEYGPALFTRVAHDMPSEVVVGAMSSFYPYQDRDEARRMYVEARSAQSPEEVARVVAGKLRGAVPYAIHMSQQGDLTLPEREAVPA